jgi:hypothetical protein
VTAEAPLSGLAIRHCVSEADRPALTKVLQAKGFEVLILDGTSVHDRATLFAATHEQLLGEQRCASWDDFQRGIEDIAWAGETQRFALVWTHADSMLGAGLGDLLTASDVLAGVSRSLYQAGIVLVMFLCGTGPGFPPMNPDWVER